MKTPKLKEDGFMMIIKTEKSLILCLWSSDKEDLEEYMTKRTRIVPHYIDDDGGEYLTVDGKLVRI